MKLRFESLVASVKVLTGAMAFFIVVLIGSIISLFRTVDPARLLTAAIVVYCLFYYMGGIFARMLERVNVEVTDIDRGKYGEKKPGEKHLGKLLDIHQSAEGPF